MITNVLSQGLTPDIANSVGSALVKFLSSDEYHSFTGISAFASQAGINGLTQHINNAKSRFKNLNIIVGVNQKSTTKEALEVLMELGLDQALIFYQPGYTIFHPKIYLFEGEHRSQLIVGSSNLTAKGLFANVEASIHLDLDNSEEADRQVITDLKAQFAGIFDFTHPNLQLITTDLIEKFVAEKIVPTEAESGAIRAKVKELDVAPDGAPIPKVIRTIFKPRPLPRAPKEFRSKKTGTATTAKIDVLVPPEEGAPGPADEEFTLVWQRQKLPASSVEIAGTENTNITGGLRLVQDKYEVDGKVIDQTTYFRHLVFNELAWVVEKTTPLVEKAIGKFHLSILGEDVGLVPLAIRHKPSGEAGQHNYTTSISWGALSKNIRDRVLTGRRLNLYRSETDYDIFKLEIV